MTKYEEELVAAALEAWFKEGGERRPAAAMLAAIRAAEAFRKQGAAWGAVPTPVAVACNTADTKVVRLHGSVRLSETLEEWIENYNRAIAWTAGDTSTTA